MAVNECPDCRGPIDNPEASFCPHCGRPLNIARHRPDEKKPQAQPPRLPPTRTPPPETDQWLRDAFGQAARTQPSPSRVVPELPVYGRIPRRVRSLRLRTVVVMAAAALIVVVAGGIAGFLVSRDDGEVNTTMASSPTTQPPPPTSGPPPPSTTTEPPLSTSTETTSVPDGGDDWPEREGWTVIIESLPVEDHGSRVAAEKLKQRLVDQGIEAGVLLSSSYRSLNPGYWAVFSGVFDTESQAIEHRNSLTSAYRDAYARWVKR
jgi:hypothetical protein